MQGCDQLRAEIAAIDWSKAVKDPGNSYEVPLHPDETAVAYVAEAAPLLLRHEQTLPASVSVADLMTVSDAGEIMPPKSTWFEPKLRDGLLIHVI